MTEASELAPLWLSVRVAALATVLVVTAGVPLAHLLAGGRFPGRGLLAGLLLLPLVLPPTVTGYVLLQVLGRRALPLLVDDGAAASQHHPELSRGHAALAGANALDLEQSGRVRVEEAAEVDADLAVRFGTEFLVLTFAALEDDR